MTDDYDAVVSKDEFRDAIWNLVVGNQWQINERQLIAVLRDVADEMHDDLESWEG